MENFSLLPASTLIRPEGFECDCGRKHIASGLKSISVGSGVINAVPEVLTSLGIKKPFIVTDCNEYEAAGKRAEAILKAAGIPYSLHVIPGEPEKRITPSEFAMGSIALNLDVSCDAILCVGSGVMNDLCKTIANLTGKPLAVIATAPSMDGYASDVASMVVNNIKLTLKEVIPAALVCDVDIMSQAPMHMLHAGLGDMIGKFSALCEWKIATIIKGEYYCAETAALVRESLRRITEGSNGVKDRNPESIKSIAEGLILSGIAMAYVGHSRPASGLEHYFSHCWEMMYLAKGEECDLHGIQVGVGTLLVLKIYEYIKTLKPDMERVKAAADSFDPDAWEANIRRVFVDTADGIIAMEKKLGKNEGAARMARAAKIIENWDEILKIAEEAPSFVEIESIMKNAGMPTTPEEIGISKKEVIDAFVCSRDVRDKYLLSSMLWDIGYMDDVAKFLESTL
ncbi:MAG: iron-containing alcohol dehydrogenase [Ruminococcaceae bacterium]|nr:iron-containing alcohol dehydrogenase [Oscillospiraceae bacterium]